MLFFFIIAGCEKNIFDEKSYNTPENNFEVFWKEFDRQYSFFSLLNLDWDSVYTVYKPRIHNNMTQSELFGVLSEMTYLLKDGHVNLYTNFGQSRYTEWYSKYPVNQLPFNYYVLNMEKPNNKIAYAKIVSHNIGYIYISSFSGENEDYEVIDQILEEFTDMDGIVIDVRSNSGGSSVNAGIIASRFANERLLYVKVRYRNGPEHTDFTNWYSHCLQPYEGNRFLKPVCVLTNRMSYSATEWFVAMMDVVSGVTIIGDTTGGGSGDPLKRQLPNGWFFRLSNSQSQLPSGRDYQLSGIYPDIPVWINKSDSINGKDTILETAIALIEEE